MVSAALVNVPRWYVDQPNVGSIVLTNLSQFRNAIEHGAVNVVAVNDPFIEPHYAVRTGTSHANKASDS